MNAAAKPTTRPASAITRRQPRSPSRASASISATVRSPWLRRSSSSSAPVEAAVSRQPRLPQRQTAPSRVDEHVAELAGHAAPAAVQAAAEDEPGADARGDLEVDEVRRAAAGAVRRTRASAPRLASLSTLTGTSSRRRSSSAAATPTQPGRIADEPMTPSDWSIGPGRPSPAPITRERSMPASASTSSISSQRDVEALLRRVVGVQRHGALGDDRRGQVGDGDAHVAVAEVDAERGAGGGVEREQDRRAPALLAVAPRRAPRARRRARRPAARRRGSRRSSARGRCGARSRRG